MDIDVNTTSLGILQLPAELMIRLSRHLSTIDLGSLRRSCKQIEKHLFESLAREFFTKRQFMLEEHSLQALVDIAKHPTLSRYLKYVIIGTERLAGAHAVAQAYRTARPMSAVLQATGQAHQMLVEAFKNLSDLKTIGVRDYSDVKRPRDGTTWRNYGWSMDLSEEEFESLRLDQRRHEIAGVGITHAFNANETTFALVMVALAEANARPESIEVFLRHNRGLEPSAFNIINGPSAQAMRDMLAGVKRLLLAANPRPETVQYADSHFHSAALLPLQRFLEALPALRALRLNLTYSSEVVPDILGWLAKRPCNAVHDSSTGDAWPDLEELEFGFFHFEASHLIPAIARFSQLRKLTLWHLSLLEKTPESGKVENHRDSWAIFLHQLGDALPSPSGLQEITISNAHQLPAPDGDYRRRREDISWVPEGTTEEDLAAAPKAESVRYRASYGTSGKEWLKTIGRRVFVPERKILTPFNHHDADDSSIEEDDDSDDEEFEDEDDGGLHD